jgi:hypothetical protein
MRTHLKGEAMADLQVEVLRDSRGREVMRFTTPCGVQGIVATCIPPQVLAKMARKLERKIASQKTRLAKASKK